MDVVVKAAVLVSIIAVGFTIKRLGWVSASLFTPLSIIALRVTLPAALAVSFDSFTLSPSLFALPLLALVLNLALMGAGYLAGRRRGDRAFGVLTVQSFNIGLFAIPYVSTFVGPQGIVYAAMFDIGNSIAGAGIGYAWGMSLASGKRVTLASFLRTVATSPVLVAYVLLGAINVFGLHLPGPVLSFASTVGAANTFVAMLMIGIGLELVLPGHKYLTAVRLLGVRYAVVAGFAVAVWFVPGLDAGVRAVLCMLAFAPIAAMISAFVDEAGLDVETSAFMTSMSILVGIVAMPLVLGLGSLSG